MILRVNGMNGTGWALVEGGADKPVHGQTDLTLTIRAPDQRKVTAQATFVCDERLHEAVTVGDDGYLYEDDKLLSGQYAQAQVTCLGGGDEVGKVVGYFYLASVDASWRAPSNLSASASSFAAVAALTWRRYSTRFACLIRARLRAWRSAAV